MNKEREKYILKKLLAERRVEVKSLAKEMYASEPSIRRDLVSLEKQGFLRRVHGGAIIEEDGNSRTKIPFLLRELEQSDEKLICAKRASELVCDGNVVFLDSSSSAYNVIPFLTSKSRLTVVTNGVKALEKAGEYNIKAISTGGDYIPQCCALVGESAREAVREYNADIMFFSCRGLSQSGKLTDFSREEDGVRREMMKNAKRVYLICTGDKVGKEYFHNICNITDIDGVISGSRLNGVLGEKQV